ncbi:MAG: Asp-tRNA(Asn)/Glu-tRNA(Gln) amidotransferase subunit GatC [Bacteroidetes bacterium]|nr:Asp-tRNA(Asn)/Glu-tRNA(Gln) amidotransferase subunit GatC [Bacteroidota bacterium]
MTKEELINISKIIQIKINDNESNVLFNQLNGITDYVSKIDNYDYMFNSETELQFMINDVNRLRDDVSNTSIALSETLKNAPKKNENFFKVPKVIE